MSDAAGWRPTLAELDALRRALFRAGGTTLELSSGDVRITMVPAPVGAPATPPATTEAAEATPGREITSDGPGVFRPAAPLRDAPFVTPGTAVDEGQIVALLQVGTALLPVTSPAAGRIEAVLAEDGEVVGYGTPLFRLAR